MRNETTRSTRRARFAAALALTLVALIGGATPATAVHGVHADEGTLDFGEVRVGTLPLDETPNVTFTNDGNSPATIGSIVNEGNQDQAFAGFTGINPDTGALDRSHDCLEASDGSSPRVLAQGESCTIFVLAYPVKNGLNTTKMTVNDEGGNELASVTLKATGTEGYYITGGLGEVLGFGDGVEYGDTTALNLNAPIIDIKQVPFGNGYWQLGLDGGVFSFGPDADFHGSTGGIQLNSPVIAMDAVSSAGYYMAALDGGVFAFGEDAAFHGSMGGQPLNAPIVGIAVDPVRDGYWLVAEDGGIFAFGESKFHGSMGGTPLNEPIVGMMGTPTGEGYWLVASDGGVFAFGDAVFRGSMGGTRLNSPVIDLAASPTGLGYWMLALDGGVFALGDAPFFGSGIDLDVATGITGTAPPTDREGFGDGGFYVSIVPDSSASAVSAGGAPTSRAAAVKSAFMRDQFAGVRSLTLRD